MMMERPRPSEEEGETTADGVVKPTEPVSAPAPPAPAVEEKVLPADPEEAIEALEQRLELLGGSTEAAETTTTTAAPELVATEDEKEEEDKPVAAPAPAPVAAPAPAPAPVVTAPAPPPPAPAPAPPVVSAPAPAKPAQQQAAAGGKSALLARIIASQERARAAEEKSRAFEQELNRPKGQPPAAAPAPPRSAAEEQEKILKALSGDTDNSKKADEPPPPPFEVAEAGMKKVDLPPPFEVAEAGMKKADNNSLLDLPPPFEVAAQAMAPPSFASVENSLPTPFEAVEKSAAPKQVKFDASAKAPTTPTVPAPSAPTFDPHEVTIAAAPAASDADFSFLQEGIERVVPPPSTSDAAPPSFEQFEAATNNQAAASELDEGAFEFDLDGNPLSPEERKKMMAEQRAIMEEIQREAALNAKAIAAAQADNFDQRSGSAAVRAVDSGPSSRSARAERGAAVAPAGSASAAAASEEAGADGERTVEIGGGQNVALHGQEKTKQAIADGTAILVQCVNCQNWMQVTESATLMFCPVCSVVSPVTKQDEVMTKEEAIQLTMDRKLAEQLQAEINAEAAEDGPRRGQRSGSAQQPQQEEEGYMAAALRKLRGEEAPAASERLIPGSSGGQSHGSRLGEKSWWDTFSEYVGVGVTEGADERRAGEISVSRPPGAGPASASARTSSEQRGLLASVDGHGGSSVAPVRDSAPVGIGSHRPPPAMQSARVAESKPLFSCVVDSMSSAASAVGTAINQNVLGDGEDIRGVDNNSLLSVTQVGRGQGGSGSYHQLESNGNL